MAGQSRGAADAALLEARLEDMIRLAERGETALSPFLTPAECAAAERFFALRGMREQVRLWGGYAEAERKRLYLLPEYLLALPDLLPPQGSDPAETLAEEALTGAVSAVRITGSGFRELSHRDYLGSLLGLGLERDALGDIAVQNPHEAVVFCTAKIRDFLLETLERVANDKVRCRVQAPDEPFTDGRRTVPVTDTVASARLDCVVAALMGGSREAAREAIEGGLVEVDYQPALRTDRPLTPPLCLSVRGIGRFRLLPFEGETRKGRLRLRAERFI
ncbi:MAG TPA: hypothetical protein DDW30_02625 [Clostridiales bacterium]|nr:hypothetical protein [Clostridiales bacterium]